ncbi:MAG: glycosyltransferase [Bacteroidetes bacterium]|nr:glycosyltransferase [Bacteroidota bacterium]
MSAKRKIKILRIINRFNIGGPTYNATFLTRFMSDDFETVLVGGLPEDGEADSFHILKEYGVKPILIPEFKRNPNFFSDRKALKKIKTIIEEFKPDIVHTHAAKAGALGRKAAFDCKVPVVVHTFHGHVFHSYFGKFKTEIFRRIEKRLASRSTGIIAISEQQKLELSEKYGIAEKNKFEVIPLGFDLDTFQVDLDRKRKETREFYSLNDNQIAVAIIGRLAPIKNHKLFLDSIEIVNRQTTKKPVFFIVGDGETRKEIELQIEKIKTNQPIDIRLTSWIQDIKTFNAGMDIICLTSNNEGTPVSLIEAQACNIPVISTDVGGVKDIIKENETGFVVPKNNPEKFGKKLLDLIEDEKKREKMSQNGWSFVKDNFHYQRLVKDMENYYLKLLKNSSFE